MERIEAAKALIVAIDAAGFDGSLYTPVHVLRVYVNKGTGRKAKECGYLQIERDGSITQAWKVGRFDLERAVAAFLAEHTIAPKAVEAPVVRVSREEDEQDQIDSAARIAAREVA